ncbi:MAG: hypothetical protein EBT80_06075 [Chitinophagales bacterium]|nr:hypothetical protein [Chitinophagales bacterium]
MKTVAQLFFKKRYGVVLALLFFVVINLVAGLAPLRLDLTKEKRYTVSAATEKLLGELSSPLEVNVFLTGEFPSGFRKLAGSTQQLLSLFKQLQPTQLRYQFLSPGDRSKRSRTIQ